MEETNTSEPRNYRVRISKGWTSIEESRILIHAGLDTNTADMYYDAGDIEARNRLHTFTEGWEDVTLHNGIPRYVPAWSTGALLSLLPESIRVYPASMKDESVQRGYVVESIRNHNISLCDDIVEAAVTAMLWSLSETRRFQTSVMEGISMADYKPKNLRIVPIKKK